MEALDLEKNPLLNLRIHQPDIDYMYLYAKDPYKAKYQLLISKQEGVGLKDYNKSKAFNEYSNGIHENIEEYNPNKGPK